MAYIKNRSKYIKQTKHQLVNGGSIWERDITTIGGLNTFDENQFPIYQSGNFILTVNTDNNISRYFQKQKWEENKDGEVWTLDNINEETNNGETDDTLKIVLKPDYHSLKSFAYYGSCVELIRGSISNIATTYPGELCLAIEEYNGEKNGINVYYVTKKGGVITSEVLGGTDYYLIDNPFDLDIHTTIIDIKKQESNPLKYIAANNNWEKYDLISGSSLYPITNIEVEYSEEGCFDAGDKLAEISVSISVSTIVIYAYMNVGNEITYLTKDITNQFSIRPKEKYLNQFYKSLDAFESILMNKNSDPKYTAIFEVTKENDYTLETTLKSFTFPTTYGEYNLAVNTVKYNHYIDSLVEVGSFYDEFYCDNLYRCMTHESIKNFDFSYTRSYEDGQTDAYIEGGEKFQKTLRLIAREFDEIKHYIDNIRNTTILTYDNIGNIPDYFLTDTLDVEGWDVINIYPLQLTESFNVNTSKFKRTSMESGWTEWNSNATIEALEEKNKVKYISREYPLIRTFNQDLTLRVSPYSKDNFEKYPYGYFLLCCDDISTNVVSGICKYDDENSPYTVVSASTREQYKYDECANETRLRIKPYTSEKVYTMNEVNNHFMKMLKLNSRAILRHKGTIKGIEMLLSLFGLKSKEYFDKLESSTCHPNSSRTYDYEIVEKTTFMKPIIDMKSNERGNMYELDWYNSTKSISYSNDEYLSGIYNSYQGLPVAYDELESGNTTVRVLLPYFNRNSEIDGKPYYQMNGGWLNKSIYKFDKDNNIITNNSLNNQLHTETLENVRSVGTLEDLFNLKPQDVNNGMVVYVEDLSQDVLVIDGKTYPLLSENVNGKEYNYISVRVSNNSVRIGNAILRDEIWVSNPFIPLEQWMMGQYISLSNIPQDSSIKIYLIEKGSYNDTQKGQSFWGTGNTYSATTAYGKWEYEYDSSSSAITTTFTPFESYIMAQRYEASFDTMGIFSGGVQYVYDYDDDGLITKMESKDSTHYFKLTNIKDKTQLGFDGWNQLSQNDVDYHKINAITNYLKGNNPHRGKLNYDDGYEYISYFTQLFKYAIERNSIDARCYSGKDDYYNSLKTITNIGFELMNGSIDECKKSYPLNKDKKIHYFGHYYKSNGTTKTFGQENTYVGGYNPIYWDSQEDVVAKKIETKILETRGLSSSSKTMYQEYEGQYTSETSAYTLSEVSDYDFANGASATTISGESTENTFGYTEQIVNTKVVEIVFYIDNAQNEYNSNSLIMTKYLDTVIVPYLTQMIPSNTILNLKYVYA